MLEELCSQHSVQLAELKVEVGSLRSEVTELRKDVKIGNDKVLTLFSKTLDRQSKLQNKSMDFSSRIFTIAFRVIAILALVAWGAEKFIKII